MSSAGEGGACDDSCGGGANGCLGNFASWRNMDGKRAKRSSSKLSGSLVSSRSGSRQGSSYTGSQLRLKGSLSFLGSRSSLASFSKRNLASDSQRFQKPAAQIFDEHGDDVTPQSLLGPDMPKKPSAFFWSDTSAPTDSVFQQTTVYSGGSFSQPFSMSVVGGGSVAEGSITSMSQLGSSLDQTRPEERARPVEAEAGEAAEVAEEGGRRREDPEEEVVITLSETPTITLLHIPGTVVGEEEDAEAVRQSNLAYQELIKNRPGNDRYSDRGMQTINNAPKTKHIQTEPLQTMDSGVSASTSDMHDTYLELREQETPPESGQDSTLEELSSRATSRLAQMSRATSRLAQLSRAPTAMGTAGHTLMPGESTFVASVFTEGGPVISTSSSRGLPTQQRTVDPTQPNDHPIMKLDSLKDQLRVVERAVIMNHMQHKQALYRKLPVLRDPDHSPSTVDSFHIQHAHLDRLWAFSCSLTEKRKVTALAWNPRNQDIVAVGYGAFSDKKQGQGIICCWSLKNSEFPDRVFHAPSGVTSLSFSHIHPNLLAAGLYNGTLALYNVRSSSHESVLDSRDALHHHSAPVWQVHWVVRERSLGEEVKSEVLVSASVDGQVLQWSVRKGFESTLLMKLKRAVLPRPPQGRKPGKATSKHGPAKAGSQGAVQVQGEAMISQHAPGLGFDFWPKDPNIYLACTEEGLIHKCSCSYNEQVLETYKGHTGPVYRVKWSPFVSDVFLSCSADWTTKLWHQDSPAPLHSFHTVQRAIRDVVWSPFHSTMFGCVSELRVDVWCLDHSMLDPLLFHKPYSGAPQNCLSFSQNAEVLLVGEASGEVDVYQLKNTPVPSDQQAEALLSIVHSLMRELT